MSYQSNPDPECLCGDPMGSICLVHPKPPREDKLRERVALLEKLAGELLDALPGCQEPNDRGVCGKPAVWGTVSHEPERCDEHRTPSTFREAQWADPARALREAIGGER